MTGSDRPLADQAGQLLRDALGDRNRTAIARAIGVSDVALIKAENGHNMTLDRLERLGRAYGVAFVLHAVPIRKGRRHAAS